MPATIMGLCCHSAGPKTPILMDELIQEEQDKSAFLNAISSLDYSNKSANKNPITSRSSSGTGVFAHGLTSCFKEVSNENTNQ